MTTLANSKDANEMQHDAAFHQGLHCLTRQNQSSVIFLFAITCVPLVYTMDHPKIFLIDPEGRYHLYIKAQEVNFHKQAGKFGFHTKTI